MDLRYQTQIDVSKLDAEIGAVLGWVRTGGKLIGLSSGEAPCIVHLVDEATKDDEDLIAAMIAAHDPTPNPTPPDKISQLEARIAALESKGIR